MLLAVMLLTVGCRTRPFELDDGGAGDGGARDMTMVDFAVRCRTHAREFVKLTALTRVDANEALGRTLRVRADIPLRQGCDVLADVEATIQPGGATDFVVITARAWRGDVSCGPEQTVSRIIDMDDMPFTNLRVTVSDGAPGGTARLDLAPTFSPVASCDPRAVGKPCQIDCQCEAGHLLARCVPTARGAGTCAIPCHQDEDCRSPLLQCSNAPTPTAPASTCIAAGPPCTSDAACPFGRRCLDGPGGRRCRPAQATTPPPPCACGADCGFGRVCEQSPTGMVQQCATPCATDGDCPLAGAPAPHRCAAGRCTPGQ